MRTISRLCLPVLLLAACTASDPPRQQEGAGFPDPFGRRPATVVHHVGRSVHLDYHIRELPTLSPAERKRQARAIAEVAWREFGGAGGLDTVLISFSHGDTINGGGWPIQTSRTRLQSQGFPFLRQDLQGVR